jgi:hypothetical protein
MENRKQETGNGERVNAGVKLSILTIHRFPISAFPVFHFISL